MERPVQQRKAVNNSKPILGFPGWEEEAEDISTMQDR
jgi:hypothetical protein